MQQIKLKFFRKKKNLTIQSIKLQIFEKNNDCVQRKYNTVDQTEKDTIFTHSKRYLQSISPKKFEQRQPKNLTESSLDQGTGLNMRRYSINDKSGSSCIKKRILFVKEINQLKLAIRRSTLSKVQESDKVNKRVEQKHLKTLVPIANEPQFPKSFSEKVKKLKTQPDVFVSEAIQFNIPKDGYQNSMLLKPLNVSIGLPGSLRKKKQNDQIRQLQHALLQENRRSLKFSRMNSRCRQTQVSPWRTHTVQTQQSFGGF